MKPHPRFPRQPSTLDRLPKGLARIGLAFVFSCLCLAADEPTVEKQAPAKEAPEKPLAEFSDKREELKLPGIKIRIKERYVDVDATVCLDSGMLELIACTKDSKEHESLIAIEAKASHVHAALLLIGARAGNPAMRKQTDEPQPRLIHIPPRGQNIDVFLEIENAEGGRTEYPIKHFLRRAEEFGDFGNEEEQEAEPEEFPTNTFLFAGSHVHKDGKSEPVYLSDESGNVISLATFGDELLCLPGFHSHGNEGLSWEANSETLPAVGTKVILRLKPQFPKNDSLEKPTTKDATEK